MAEELQEAPKDRDLTEDERASVALINESVNNFKLVSIEKYVDLHWVDKVRVSCRVLETRKQIRKNTSVFSVFKEILDGAFDIKGFSASESLNIVILVISSLANIVVEDEKETLPTAFAVLRSGLYVRIVQFLRDSMDASSYEEELRPLYNRLQLVATIAITNMTVQFVQDWKTKDERGGEIVDLLLEEEEDIEAFSLFVMVTCKGADDGVKRAGINLISRMAEFKRLRARILDAPCFVDVLGLMMSSIESNSNEDHMTLDCHCLLSLYAQCSPKHAQVFHSLCDSVLLKVLEFQSLWPVNIKHLAIRLFKITIRGRMLMPNEDLTEEETASIEEKIVMLRQVPGLYTLIKSNLVALKEELKGSRALSDWESFEAPNSLLLAHLEFVSSFLHPVDSKNPEIDLLLSEDFDTLLFEIVEFVTIYVDISIKDATVKKETDKDHDINRELVLSYAKVRKSALMLLNLLATNGERCMTLITKEHRTGSVHDEYDFKGSQLYLVLFVLNTMFRFDVEGSENCLTLLKNLFLDESARLFIFKTKVPELGIDLNEFFTNLLFMIKHPAHKVIMLTTNLIRMIIGLRDLELTSLFLSTENMTKLMSFTMKDIHPLLKVEISRMYCYLLEVFEFKEDYAALKKMITKDRFEFITFLLQSHHHLLLLEGLRGLYFCDTELLKEVSEDLELIFMGNSEDFSVLELLQDGNVEALEDIFGAIEDVDKLNITEEDVAIHKKPEEELRKEISEKLSRREEESQILKKQRAEREETEALSKGDKPNLEKIPVKYRLMQLGKNMFYYDDIETEDHEKIVSLAKQVLDKLYS